MELLFKYKQKEVRTLEVNGEVQFVAKDVCDILELDNVSLAVNGRPDRPGSGLDDDEKGIAIVNTAVGEQEMLTINEAGLYTLIIRSNKPEARKFKRWITHEVLPQIRKTGKYDPNQPVALPLIAHTSREIQVAMSKAVSGFKFRRGGKLGCVKYHTRHCKAITGKTPKAVKAEGKRRNLSATICRSALEVLRNIQPSKASVASFDNHLVALGYDEGKVFNLGLQAETVFKGMLEMGVVPLELKAKS